MTEETTQRAQAPAPGPRVIADRYVLLGELGRGGMGVVFRAEDRVIGRQVAIKELRLPDGADDAGVFSERVLREVRTGGRLNDPAVVTVFDVVSEAGTTYIVMELVEAPTLSDLVRERGPLPAQQVASIGLQVLSALQAAHEAGIVHRDVKPGNIMVAPNGRVKLTDFGIAQAVDDPRLTTSGMIVGSPAFMAPERVSGQEAGPASDLWSLGVTLYFAAEGVLAFERTSTAATLHAIMNEVPYLTRTQGPLASVVMGFLVASPEGRLTAHQAHGLLQMASAGTGQHTPTSVYTGPPPTMAGPAPTHYAHQPQAAPAPSKGKRPLLVTGAALAGVALLAGGFFLGNWWGSPSEDSAMLPALTYGTQGDIQQFDTPSSSQRCYNVPLEPGRSISSSNKVDCDEQHDFEVFATLGTLGGDSSVSDSAPAAAYPAEDRLRISAETRCEMIFHSNVVQASQRSGLQYRALLPTQQAWDAREDSSGNLVRNAYCVLSKTGGGTLSSPAAVEVR
ncbi:serine/threonine-protein kinase [Amycolatopsis albispora]|uniref:non-specific serine/threonine protein kinase n=1 Tax=Amycolatopsis albispora TaxID=1804986 RepID=A0A344LJ52_9PSEU|nr:serine/threonine-protein kinase [Amycolatopsis albispora]AXB48076.1 serine/threonine protein kinase [Amycolatopsis albispora]